jgi:hypothetical protein
VHTLIFDIETTSWFDDLPAAPREAQLMMMEFGLAVAVLIDDQGTATTNTYGAGQQLGIVELWDEICAAHTVVTFNGLQFDLPICYQEAALATQVRPPWPEGQQIDLWASIKDATGRWYSLNEVALATLGREKSASGRQAAEWLKSGDPALIARCVEYCTLDVELTQALWYHACVRRLPMLLPAREKRREQHDYRLWLDGAGRPERLEWGI